MIGVGLVPGSSVLSKQDSIPKNALSATNTALKRHSAFQFVFSPIFCIAALILLHDSVPLLMRLPGGRLWMMCLLVELLRLSIEESIEDLTQCLWVLLLRLLIVNIFNSCQSHMFDILQQSKKINSHLCFCFYSTGNNSSNLL